MGFWLYFSNKVRVTAGLGFRFGKRITSPSSFKMVRGRKETSDFPLWILPFIIVVGVAVVFISLGSWWMGKGSPEWVVSTYLQFRKTGQKRFLEELQEYWENVDGTRTPTGDLGMFFDNIDYLTKWGAEVRWDFQVFRSQFTDEPAYVEVYVPVVIHAETLFPQDGGTTQFEERMKIRMIRLEDRWFFAPR